MFIVIFAIYFMNYLVKVTLKVFIFLAGGNTASFMDTVIYTMIVVKTYLCLLSYKSVAKKLIINGLKVAVITAETINANEL